MDQITRANTIKKLISEEELGIKNLKDEKIRLINLIDTISIQIEFKNKNKEYLDSELSKLNLPSDDTTPLTKKKQELPETLANQIRNDTSSTTQQHESLESLQLQISKEYTLTILSGNDVPNEGLQTKDIIQKYKSVGIVTYNQTIDSQLKELVKAGAIYQTNPDNTRGKKFAVKKRSLNLL
jgi:hypothetical protein